MQCSAIEVNDRVQRIVLDGRLDAPGAGAIETRFTALVSAGGRHVLLDLREVPFVGSLGVRLIIANARVLQRRGLLLVIFGAQPQAKDVFATVGLDTLVPIVEGEAEALARVAEAA